MWRATVLTLYPEMFPGPLGLSLSGEALACGDWSLEARNIRDHGRGRHRPQYAEPGRRPCMGEFPQLP